MQMILIHLHFLSDCRALDEEQVNVDVKVTRLNTPRHSAHLQVAKKLKLKIFTLVSLKIS